mmetsp:Transcript_2984/g.6943  ORF Transcript_2984/g.6943 Transcript_2984/m.6943 type:complete len:303 (-) Transcript_2984:26-934(-)
MQEFQRHLQEVKQDLLRCGSLRAFGVATEVLLQAGLRSLDIPSRHVLLQELLDLLCWRSKAIRLQSCCDALAESVALGQERALQPGHGLNLIFRELHATLKVGSNGLSVLLVLDDDKPANVPDLVGKCLGILQGALANRHIHARDTAGQQGIPERVGAEVRDGIQRVDDVAFGLAHLLSFIVSDKSVEVDLLEWCLVRECEAHHYHPSHPEEQDVVSSLHHGGRVEFCVVPCRFIWPADRGKGPKTRREPGVQHVVILSQLHILAKLLASSFQGLFFGTCHEVLVAPRLVGGVIHGDSMAPP